MKHLRIDIEKFETNKKEILKDISFILNENDRIALVGPNGAGKTTFFKILTGEIKDYFGKIENIGSISLGYLSQIHFDNEDRFVKDELKLAFSSLLAIENELVILEKQMQDNSEDINIIESYSTKLEQFNNLGGYNIDYEIHKVANGLGILDLLDGSIKHVSGGQRTKIALAKMLLSSPDFLLLDEPTNFIDLASTKWLEKYLKTTWKGGYFLISHDRDFLDKTCNKVIEISGPRKLEFYNGNYSYYVKEKLHREEILLEDYERQQDYIKSQTQLVNRFRAGSRAGWAKSREKMLDKMDILEKPFIQKKPKFHFVFDEPSGNRILYFKDVFIGRREPLFYIREVELSLGQRIGIIGENGAGKSTFLKTILGEIPKLEGLINIGKGLKISYYSQLHEELDMNLTLRENFIKHGFDYSKDKLTAIITNYLFTIDDIDKKASEFSGGQISKLLFAILGQKESNFLILDEPTNHLDYEFREALETELAKFKGTVLFISHDRYFINKVATHLWIINDGELAVSYGNYDDYEFRLERGLSFDASLFDEEAQLNLALEDKLGSNEAKRIRQKFSRKR